MRLGLLLIALYGCATGARQFAIERVDAICAWHERCDTLGAAGFENVEQCEKALQEAESQLNQRGELACPSFDQDAADTCLAIYDDVACDEVPDLGPCDAVCT